MSCPFLIFFLFFIYALLSTSSRYSAISHYITKNISHASTRRNKERKEQKKRKKKKKKRREYKHQFTEKYILYIYLHFHRILQCNLNTENILCRSAPLIFFYFLCETVKGGAYINRFNCLTIFRFWHLIYIHFNLIFKHHKKRFAFCKLAFMNVKFT